MGDSHLAGGRTLEAGEVRAQARFVRTSQTGLEARPRAALHDRAKSVPGTAPLQPPRCVCVRIQPWPRWEAPAARGWRASLEAQTQGQCQMPGIFCQLRGLRAVTRRWLCTCATPSRPAINSRRQRSDAGSLTAPSPGTGINQPPR